MPITVCGGHDYIIHITLSAEGDSAEVTVHHGTRLREGGHRPGWADLGHMKNFTHTLAHTDIHAHMPVAGGGLHLCEEVDIPRPWSGCSHPKHCTSSPSGVSHSSVAFPPSLRQILFPDGPL